MSVVKTGAPKRSAIWTSAASAPAAMTPPPARITGFCQPDRRSLSNPRSAGFGGFGSGVLGLVLGFGGGFGGH